MSGLRRNPEVHHGPCDGIFFSLAASGATRQNWSMQIHLTPRNIVLTGAIHSFVAEKVEHLEGHGEQIMGAHIVLLHDQSKKKPYHVKVHLALPGPDIHAEDSEADLYAAIDKVVDKLSQQLRKRKTKKKDHVKHVQQLTREGAKRGFKRR